MTLLVRDEEDILQSNIEYHLAQGVDFIIATDNRSIDSTREILKSFERMDVLHYIYEGDDNYNQYKWVTRMARMASIRYDADWVINSDADEFWWPLHENTLKNAFMNLPQGTNIVRARRKNFVFIPRPADTQEFYRTMIYQETISLNPLGRPLSPKSAHIGSNDISVRQGNHRVDGIFPMVISDDAVEIFHFPVRSKSQIENKIAKGGAAYNNNNELPEAIGRTWRELYDNYRKLGNIDKYIDEQCYDKERIRHEISNGNIIENRKLLRFFENNYEMAISNTKK